MFYHLNHLPYDNEINKDAYLEKHKLIVILKDMDKFKESPYFNKVDNMSVDDLRKLFTLFSMNKPEL